MRAGEREDGTVGQKRQTQTHNLSIRSWLECTKVEVYEISEIE